MSQDAKHVQLKNVDTNYSNVDSQYWYLKYVFFGSHCPAKTTFSWSSDFTSSFMLHLLNFGEASTKKVKKVMYRCVSCKSSPLCIIDV